MNSTAPVYSVVIPVHNEAECLNAEVSELVEGLEAQKVDYELILAENGSSDDTPAMCDTLAEANPRIKALRVPVPDYGAAMKTGMLAGRGRLIVNFDIDFHDVAFMLKAGEVLGEGAAASGAAAGAASGGASSPGAAPDGAAPDSAAPDSAAGATAEQPGIVVGSKLVKGADDRRSWARHLVSLGFTTILRILFDPRMDDTHGMKVLKREVVAEFAPQTIKTTDLFDTELIIRARRAGVVVKALPVTVEEKRKPRSSILRRIPRTIRGLVSLRIALFREGGPGS